MKNVLSVGLFWSNALFLCCFQPKFKAVLTSIDKSISANKRFFQSTIFFYFSCMLYSKLFFVILVLFTWLAYGQERTVEINTPVKDREQFHYSTNGEARIKYLAFNEFIIRQEDNTITFLDENLNKVDAITIPENSSRTDYKIDQDGDYLYVLQKSYFAEPKSPNHKFIFYKVDLYDFSLFKSFEITGESTFTAVSLTLFKGNVLLALLNGETLLELQVVSAKSNTLTSVNYEQYAIEECEGGNWSGPTILKEELILSVLKTDENENQIRHILYLDQNLAPVKETIFRFDLRTNSYIYTDESGTEIKSISNKTMRIRDLEPVPYSVEVNGQKIWIKTTYKQKGYSTKIEATWISRDSAGIYLNLSEHLKREMKASGASKSTGMNIPKIYADPINNSIIVQYWLVSNVEINNMGKLVESFVYFNLDSDFNLRNMYKVKMSRYPLADATSRLMTDRANQILSATTNISFEIDKTPKQWEGDSQSNKNNAFDYLFSGSRVDGLCTVINATNTQYLFVDTKNGGTVGYIFKTVNKY